MINFVPRASTRARLGAPLGAVSCCGTDNEQDGSNGPWTVESRHPAAVAAGERADWPTDGLSSPVGRGPQLRNFGRGTDVGGLQWVS